MLFSIYTLGLAIPFLLTALAINQGFGAFTMLRRHYHTIEIVSGVADDRHRRADLHEPLHDHRPVADPYLPRPLGWPPDLKLI